MDSYNLTNCKIITLNQQNEYVDNLTVENGKITSINNTNPKFKNIDLDGGIVIPGFIDAHYHLKNFGKRLSQLMLKDIHSLDKIKILIEQYIQNLKPGEWLLGFGWDQNLWGGNFPNKDFLNHISDSHPVYLTRIDGHASWVNDNAINLIGKEINELNNIEGGQVINGCIMVDNAMNPFKKHLPKEDKQQVKSWILKAVKKTQERGITGVHDAWQDLQVIKVIKELIKENKFSLRCYGMLASNDDDLLNNFFQEGHYYDEYYSIRSVKAFIDGALGSRGAALHEPYCDDLNNCGLILISDEKFKSLSELCVKNNFQLNTHAIGDRGNHYVLNHYSSVLPVNNTRRWRIEHAQMVSDLDLERFKINNIIPSMQPSHCTSDMKWLDKRIGEKRLNLISRWQSFINLGLIIPGGSDCPIETGNPIFEFYAAITRQDHSGWPKNGWQSQEKINRLNALKMFTSWAAYGGFNEQQRGKIAIGYDADFTVISNDLLSVSLDEILNTTILHTIINGKFVYSL